MQYEDEFTKVFMARTISIIDEYNGQYDATLLINSLLGLLVLPKEHYFDRLPNDSIITIDEWGINKSSIRLLNHNYNNSKKEIKLKCFIRHLRNAVAHFKIEPIYENKQISGFSFQDQKNFEAIISLNELNEFIKALARYIKDAD